MALERKFLKDFGNDFNNLRQQDIKEAVLLGVGTRSLEEANDLANRPNLKKLIAILKVKIFLINKKDEISIVA